LARLSTALAFRIFKPGQSRQWRLGFGLAWPEPRPEALKSQ
jgi:hypothetical protein